MNAIDNNKEEMFAMRIQEMDSAAIESRKSYSSVKYSELTEDEKREFIGELDCLPNNFICENVKSHYGDICMFSDFWSMLSDERNKMIAKKNRKLVFSTGQRHRVTGDEAFAGWTGFQIIDLDIKDENIAVVIKSMLFDILCRFPWFVGIALSSSHTGIHVYTWTSVCSFTLEARKKEYYSNFEQKCGAVFSALEAASAKLLYKGKYAEYNINPSSVQFTEMTHWIDTAMARPQQGAFIPYDENAELSTNFVNVSVGFNFESDDDAKNGITRDPRLDEILKRVKYFNNSDDENGGSVSIEDVEYTTDINIDKFNKKHYKYNERYQLANTLVHLFGENAFAYLRAICAGTPSDELRGYINTAKTHNKGVSEWAVNELRTRHGFEIKLKSDATEIAQSVKNDESDVKSPVEQLSKIDNKVTLTLKQGQYLSDIQDSILKEMNDITILDAGAGYGKTEMVKRMGGRKILVLPYTSIIESKIEADEEISENWLNFYSNKQVGPEHLFCSDKSCVMTIDKFSRLNIDDIACAGFDTIWVDESHLLFISSYRSVMSGAVERLAQMPARGVKVVLMTGTPIAENLFFPNKKYIKVEREVDSRIKEVNINFSYKKSESDYHMCCEMADCIECGKRILYPTNDGVRRFKQVTSLVQEILNERHFGRKINTFYYKKSNSGTKEMKDINESKTVGDNDIVGCTSFLSVGVDICDNFEFTVFFDTLFMPQDVEQFANRIRNNNLFINIYLKEYNSDDSVIDYNANNDIDFEISYSEKVFLHNTLQLLNDQIERCEDEIKYSSIIANMVSDKTFVYDEDERKYRVEWTSYLLHTFEDRYKKYSTQLPCFIKAMQYYGYNVISNENLEQFTDAKRERINEILKESKNVSVSEFTTAAFELLDSLNADNIEIYSAGVKEANYDIFRSDAYEDDRLNNNIKCTNVEAIIKNIPLITGLYKWYDFDVIKEIYNNNTSRTTNEIKFKNIKKLCNFIYIETKRMQKRLDVADLSFIRAARNFALANGVVKKQELDEFISDRVCYALNRINRIVTFNPDNTESITYKGSIEFAKTVKKQYEKLFNIYIETVKTSRKDNTVIIRPFNPAYDKKEDFSNIYGDVNLKAVMGDEFTHRMRGISIENDKDDTDIDNISTATTAEIDKYDTENVHVQYLSDIPADFTSPKSTSFYEYTDEDGSAARFVEKQHRQHSEAAKVMRAGQQENNEIIYKENNKENTLFDTLNEIETPEDRPKTTERAMQAASFNTEDDIQMGMDWDLVDSLGLLGDDGMGI